MSVAVDPSKGVGSVAVDVSLWIDSSVGVSAKASVSLEAPPVGTVDAVVPAVVTFGKPAASTIVAGMIGSGRDTEHATSRHVAVRIVRFSLLLISFSNSIQKLYTRRTLVVSSYRYPFAKKMKTIVYILKEGG